MKNTTDPKYDLLKSFIDFLRDEDYTLLDNGVFRDHSKWFKLPPRKGDNVAINISFQGKVPSEQTEDILIDTFLSVYKK